VSTILKAPSELNLDSWWQAANCKGLEIKQVTSQVCAGCSVYKECLWTAMTEDDRIDYGMFIRGGLSGNMRDRLWYGPRYRTNRLDAFKAACKEAERMRESIVN
jgi:hypothetical protein